ncbi:MAG: NADH-quinone oxidoreductase subunit NuoE [Elusimicrobiaceae bacterium]|nr:NADH-quinone oxidoreductase subunit NuoE [Elusimicrobiaceae bacterium]MBR3899261.1 NADH-quinone oxidoreductase subunit NuoE [Elusimicrobiaceae bacterium]
MTEKFAPVDKILKEQGNDPAKLIPILQKVQELYRYLPEDVMRHIANKLEISPAKVFGVATFFAHFAITPKGKHIIKVCNGTACHVKGSSYVINTIKEKLNLKEGQDTTEDGLFTLECVSCLGACGLAPVMVVDEVVHGQISPAQACKLIDEIAAAEAKNA